MKLLIALFFSTTLFAGQLPVDRAFKVYESQNNALSDFSFMIRRDRQNMKIVSPSDKGYDKISIVIDEVMVGFRALYPKLVGGLDSPFPVILNDRTLNGYVLPHSINKDNRTPYLIVVNTGAILNLNSDALHGLIAHELAHLFFQTTRPSVKKEIEKFYYVNDLANEPLGFKQKNNKFIEFVIGYYLKAQRNRNYRKIRAVKLKFNLNKLRYFSTEEFADDTSVRLLSYLGKNPIGIGLYSLKWLSKSKQKSCKERVLQGLPIAYGPLKIPHHSDCFRYSHAIAVSKDL